MGCKKSRCAFKTCFQASPSLHALVFLNRLRRCASAVALLSPAPWYREVGGGLVDVQPETPSLHRDSSVLSGEKPLRKGRLAITTLRHGPIHIFLGICSGCSNFEHSFLSPHRPMRGGEKRKGCDVKDRARAGLGRRRAGSTYSQLVKPSLKHKTPSPHTLVSFVPSPPRCLQ